MIQAVKKENFFYFFTNKYSLFKFIQICIALFFVFMVERSFANFLSPTEFKEQFLKTQTEGQRFQLFSDLGNGSEDIIKSPQTREYVGAIHEMIEFSNSKGDQSWVPGKGREVLQKIGIGKVNGIIQSGHPIPLESEEVEDFIFYFLMTGEQTQLNYFSKVATEALLNNQDLLFLQRAYGSLERIQIRLNTPIDYIFNSARIVLQQASFLVLRQYEKLKFTEMEIWLPRVGSDGYSKLFEIMENDLQPGPEFLNENIKKMIWTCQYVYTLLYEKFKNDPFNDWQYNRPLNLLKTIFLKGESKGWEIGIQEIKFLLSHLTNTTLVAFAEAFTDTLFKIESLPRASGRRLMPIYNAIKEELTKRGLESRYFESGLSFVYRSQINFDELEGTYEIDHPGFARFIVFRKNLNTLVGGLEHRHHFYSALFNNIDYVDPKTGNFISGSTVSSVRYVLSFKMTKPGFIEGCVDNVCFKGKKVQSFPNYFSQMGQIPKNPPPKIEGIVPFKGRVVLPNGRETSMAMSLAVVKGSYMGGMVIDQRISFDFSEGIRENKWGIIVMSGQAPNVEAIHQFRGFINSKNQLEGSWISTNLGFINRVQLSKVRK